LLRRGQGIIDFTTPRSKKKVQRFLGMLNYDRKFIKNVTELASPLYKLLNNEEGLLGMKLVNQHLLELNKSGVKI
ncbi:hypothetical protein H312_02720, partial [Anncaliia algerae PRA339]